jgi:hypothetical protein
MISPERVDTFRDDLQETDRNVELTLPAKPEQKEDPSADTVIAPKWLTFRNNEELHGYYKFLKAIIDADDILDLFNRISVIYLLEH